MAAKKTEEMTKEVRNEETTEEVKAEAKPEEKPDDWVNVYLMRDSDKYKGDVFVQVNGVGYIIQRGKNVKVPKAVYPWGGYVFHGGKAASWEQSSFRFSLIYLLFYRGSVFLRCRWIHGSPSF